MSRIDVEAARPKRAQLALQFSVSGRVRDLILPPLVAPARADLLWQHTCFEAFVRPGGGNVYYEFNIAPSSQWAAYRFTDYRTGMSVLGGVDAVRIEANSDGALYELKAALQFDTAAGHPSDEIWHAGISAVIEETNGQKSYWALAHPAGKPDFHHPDCFVLELPPASRP